MPNKLSLKDFIEKAIGIHSNYYDYSSSIYVNNKTKIVIICPAHGPFSQRPGDHINGQGCPICGGTLKMSPNGFIEQAREVHGALYDYSIVNYINNRTSISIICSLHGRFDQYPQNHLKGHGCPTCGHLITAKYRNSNTEKFIEAATKIHENKYDYSMVEYIKSRIPIIILCPLHEQFKQMPVVHLLGHGCLRCHSTISKQEEDWLEYLNIPTIITQYRIKISNKTYRVDGFDPNTNTIYEFYGDFWHGNPGIYSPDDINIMNKKTFGSLYQKTLEKEKELKQLGYNIIYIWEKQWKEQNRGI